MCQLSIALTLMVRKFRRNKKEIFNFTTAAEAITCVLEIEVEGAELRNISIR